MGCGRNGPLNLLLLALVWGQAGALCGQQAAPSQMPPNPVPPAPRAGAAPPPEEGEDFRKLSLSHLRLERSNHLIDVYLFAPDENVKVLDASYCGGDKGAKQHTGHFQLVSVVDNVQLSRINLDPGDWFVGGKAHDGARLFHDPKTGQNLVALYQYGNCNSETVQFVSSDADGHLFSIPFLDRDGRIWRQRLTGPDGAIPLANNGALMFCSYANDIGYDFCDAYNFDGANFLDAGKWMTPERAAPAKGANDAGRAARALFEFLYLLSVKGYSAAGYYFDGKLETAGSVQGAATRGQKAAYLENYCTVMGGQCLMPTKIESKPNTGSPATLLFSASFQTADFQPLKIGTRSSFDFRVTKTPDGFKVLDLPPGSE